MADRPILFSAPMVRALLDGRKTQTRRLLEPNSHIMSAHRVECIGGKWYACEFADRRWPLRLPYAVGDRLWVREAWRFQLEYDDLKGSDLPQMRSLVEYDLEVRQHGSREAGRYRHARFMPRFASRLTLIVTDVRVQRLQDVSEGDALAEGLAALTKDRRLVKYGIPDSEGLPGANDHGWPWAAGRLTPILAYADLWDSLHNKAGTRWADNPWIVAVTFEVHRCNIDVLEAVHG